MDHPDTHQAMVHLAAAFRSLGELGEAKEPDIIQEQDWRKEHLRMVHTQQWPIWQ
jgi:hypothetical protein